MKIHVAAMHIKSKKILSLKVTDEHIHDSKMLPRLIEDIIKSKDVRINKVFVANVAYNSNAYLRCLSNNMIIPCIKFRKNAKVRKTNNTIRILSVISQKMICHKDRKIAQDLEEMDCRNHVFMFKEKVSRLRLFYKISKHGERNDIESIAL